MTTRQVIASFSFLLLTSLVALPADVSAATVDSALAVSSTSPVQEGAIAKWQDRRFGMFIHWGPVSLKGTEISWSRAGERRDVTKKLPVDLEIPMNIPVKEYDALYKQFNPVKFNADEWVSIATATVNLTFLPQTGTNSAQISVSGGVVSGTLYGTPTVLYDIQLKTNLLDPVWTTLASPPLSNAPPYTAGADGSIHFVDTNPPPFQGFYQIIQH